MIFLPLCQSYVVWIPVALQHILKSGNLSPPILFFLFSLQDSFGYPGPIWILGQLVPLLQKQNHWHLTQITLNAQVVGLGLTCDKHDWRCFHLFIFFSVVFFISILCVPMCKSSSLWILFLDILSCSGASASGVGSFQVADRCRADFRSDRSREWCSNVWEDLTTFPGNISTNPGKPLSRAQSLPGQSVYGTPPSAPPPERGPGSILLTALPCLIRWPGSSVKVVKPLCPHLLMDSEFVPFLLFFLKMCVLIWGREEERDHPSADVVPTWLPSPEQGQA